MASTSEADGCSLSHYVSFDISGFSRLELRSLKARLMSELDRVRSLSGRIESGDIRNGPNPKKRPMPFEQPNKDQKRFASCSNGKQQPQQPQFVANPQVMRACLQVLTKLMKQKAGYVFNSPVDVVGLGLHDYHQIISKPMDLGTIKMNLNKNLYHTPEEFAADVRLTFNNALLYNPNGHEVHILAQQFLEKFEQLFRPVYHKYQSEKQQQLRHQRPDNRSREDVVVVVDEVQGSSWSKNLSPEMPKMLNSQKKQERIEIPRLEPQSRVETPPPPPPPQPQPQAPAVTAPLPPAPAPALVPDVGPAFVKGQVGRGPTGKLPKPKAKDPNKRQMSAEEKHKLGAGLTSLPEEKMNQVVQIIRKRNGDLTQDGDEIEVDIEAVDTETLWELDRFVTNYKKMVSKIRRQALIGIPNNNVGHPDTNQAGVSERMVDSGKARKGGGDVGEEDVDIGDEMPVNNYPPLEIEKDDDRQGGGSSSSSSSSSSGSDSSSSSDSDSGSSSGSDSDVDDAQSRDNESKNVHH